jgi:glycosyltransferase involved in cell wall biosynthesis
MFSPLPPTVSGIADYTSDLVRALAPRHDFHVFVATPEEIAAAGRERVVQVSSAHDFPWRQHRAPFDLVVYQMGNASCHDFMWPYLFRYPGLVVLHDAQLHHARGWSLLRRRRMDDYRAELAFNHPALAPEAAEPALAGFPGLIYYFWPMLRTVMLSARAVAVHSPALAADLATEFPNVPIDSIRMGVPASTATPAQIAAIRERHGLASSAIVVAAFGGVTREKGLGPLMRAAGVARRYQPALRLLVVGPTRIDFDVEAEARAAGVADILTVTGRVADDEIAAYLGASDVVSCLRWPSARETSASWLRALAAGRATLITELAHQAGFPTLDPRNWTTVHAQPTLDRLAPVAVGIDPLDEGHSLAIGLKRLVSDGELRENLAAEALRYWNAGHTVEHMAADYLTVLAAAAERPAPTAELPRHVRPDGLEGARAILAPLGFRMEDVFGRAPKAHLTRDGSEDERRR